MQLLVAFLVAMHLRVAAIAAPERATQAAITVLRGSESGTCWAAASIDPRRCVIDLAVSGRERDHWTASFATVDALARQWSVAVNGTFFSMRYNEPVGILVYDGGRSAWNPRVKRWYGAHQRSVVELRRAFLAVLDDGTLRVGCSEGATAEAVSRRVARDTGRAVHLLVGGGGRLVAGGRRVLSAESLAREGFDALSGLRPEAPARRTGLGVTADGRLLLVTCGLEGGGLSLAAFADLFVRLGAREAIFLDCGSSTGMRLPGVWSRGGRPVPTWVVARERP